ncbi:MAG: restriction endonuclease [Candidatus Pacebacteria bacterium]|nr:restriction endonuclease [Candidatus Paceibacterota bacterium]
MKIIVKKKNEESEIFDYAKLKNSIKFSGGSQSVVDMIVNYLIKEGMNTISSNELYQLTQKFLLKTKEKKAFLRYNLPQSIQKLGPEGFAFEKFVANVFRSYEYNPVFVGKKIQGKCMVHEMDIVAKKNGELLTAELKFHNSRSKKSDLKVVLYMKARFDDILNGKFYENQTPRQVIITNTKFSHNAKIYAKCAGVEIIA